MKIKILYTIYGFLFGCSFPIFAIIVEIATSELPMSFSSIGPAHTQNVLIFMIDSAPIFLGLFALLGGVSKAKSVALLKEFKQTAEALYNDNQNLQTYSEEIFSKLISSTEEIYRLTKQIKDSNKSVYDNVVKNKHKADDVKENTSNLIDSITGFVGQNKDLKTITESISSQIESFLQMVKALTRNFNKIEQVGTKISLLSINSGIEAHRAGKEAGGFKVISQNIKLLSEEIGFTNKDTQALTSKVEQDLKMIEDHLKMQAEKLDLISKSVQNLEYTTTLSKTNLEEISMNIENSIQIQCNQNIHLEDISKRIFLLENEKTSLVKGLKNIVNSNSDLIERISGL